MKDYVRAERAKRDALAGDFDSWYVRNKGALFDRCERLAFVHGVGTRPSARVLDLGCGTGRIARAIDAHVGAVVGTDISVESLRVFSSKSRLPAAAADAGMGLPFRDCSFDVVVCSEVFNRLKQPELERAMAECWRVLSPGGSLLTSVYNDRYWRSPWLASRLARGVEAARFSTGRMRELALAHGYTLSGVGYFKALPFTRLKHQGWLAMDRVLCRLPVLAPRLGAFTLFTLVRRDG